MIKYFYPGAREKMVTVDRAIVAIAVVQVLAELFAWETTKSILKCIPIAGLIYITLEIKKIHKLDNAKYLVAALVFGAIGDFFLLFQPVAMFLIGMVSFLISHLFYITLLSIESTVIGTPTDQQKRNIAVGVGVLWGLSILNAVMIWDKLPSQVGVTSYGIVLCTMISMTIRRYKSVPPQSYWPVMAGGILFGISDNIIGMTKFNNINNPITNVIVMSTYYASQYLLTYGNLLGINRRPSASTAQNNQKVGNIPKIQ